MTVDEMEQAINDARRTLNAADDVAYRLARLLPGRLRKCSLTTVAALKKELRDFNIHTGRWRE